MSPGLRKKYDPEFKTSAVQLVLRGKKVQEVAQDLGINRSMLNRWCHEYLQDHEHAFPGQGHLKPEDQRIRDLERQLRDVTEERDILKKALTVFSKHSK